MADKWARQQFTVITAAVLAPSFGVLNKPKMTANNVTIIVALAFFTWPIVALWFYSTRPVGRATLWTFFGGFLLLPASAGIKIAMIPPFDKNSITSLAALFGCVIVARHRVRPTKGFGLAEVFLLTLLISPLVTASLNGDLVNFRNAQLPALGLYDGGSIFFRNLVMLIPFFIGREILRGANDNEDMLRALVAGGLIYSLPALFEIRMSPTLNYKIYGFIFENDFFQETRGGSFRPVVFLGTGLHLTFFMMTTVVAAAALWRVRPRIFRAPAAAIVGYLGLVLLLCKSLASIGYAAILVPLVRWAKPRTQLRLALVLVVIAISYPLLRSADLVPASAIVNIAKVASPSRALSLDQRFKSEYKFLEHAWPRFWFGWGQFDRWRVRDQLGNPTANADGVWILRIAESGFVGFFGYFALLGFTVLRAISAFRFVQSRQDEYYLAALTLIIALSLANLVLNSDIFPWTWLYAGALLGRAEALWTTAKGRYYASGVTLDQPPRMAAETRKFISTETRN